MVTYCTTLLHMPLRDETLPNTCVSSVFQVEYRKTKTKVITLANQKGQRQYSEPIKTRSNYM